MRIQLEVLHLANKQAYKTIKRDRSERQKYSFS